MSALAAREAVTSGAFIADSFLVASLHPAFKRPYKRVRLRPDQPERPWPDAGWRRERAGGRWFHPATRRCRRVVESPDMRWPDGLVAGRDGWIYVVTSKLPTAAAFNGGKSEARPPWPVFRFKPPAPPTGAGGGVPAPAAG